MSCVRCGDRADCERRCAYCGDDVELCDEHLARTFLCEACFSVVREEGKDVARELGRERERRAVMGRVRARLDVEKLPHIPQPNPNAPTRRGTERRNIIPVRDTAPRPRGPPHWQPGQLELW